MMRDYIHLKSILYCILSGDTLGMNSLSALTGGMYESEYAHQKYSSWHQKDQNRLDLSFYSQTGKIQYALEFKKMWTAEGFKHDADRLAGLISVLGTGKGGPLTCAVFTCLVAASGNSRENTLDRLRLKIDTYGKRCHDYMTKTLSKSVTFYNLTSSLDYKDIGAVLTEDGTQALASLCVRMNNSRGNQE